MLQIKLQRKNVKKKKELEVNKLTQQEKRSNNDERTLSKRCQRH